MQLEHFILRVEFFTFCTWLAAIQFQIIRANEYRPAGAAHKNRNDLQETEDEFPDTIYDLEHPPLQVRTSPVPFPRHLGWHVKTMNDKNENNM